MVDALRWMPIVLRMHGLRRVLTVLLTALVLVQTVGVMHRTAHAQQRAGVDAHAAVSAVMKDDVSVLVAIWGEHSNSVECQLFDQTCPDLLHGPVWALPLASVVPIWMTAFLLERFALFERFYAARGPPGVLL